MRFDSASHGADPNLPCVRDGDVQLCPHWQALDPANPAISVLQPRLHHPDSQSTISPRELRINRTGSNASYVADAATAWRPPGTLVVTEGKRRPLEGLRTGPERFDRETGAVRRFQLSATSHPAEWRQSVPEADTQALGSPACGP